MTEVVPARPRYAAFDEIGAGGMATVHLGRQLGAAGFSKTVAVKRLRPERVRDAEFVAMFADEARLAARVRHPNVVQTLDVVGEGGELFLVLEYVHGESLDALADGARALGERVPADVASALLVGVLGGLHAAHVARAEGGAPLDIVHRDVSPQNVLVGVDGVARLIDFGIAKASVRLRSTRDGKLKGKLPYMAPEQLAGDEATALSDLYAAGVLLWELLAGRRPFDAPNEGALLAQILEGRAPLLAPHAPALPAAIGLLVARALAREPRARFGSARDMALALELALPPASPRRVGEWVERVAGPALARRAERVAAIERETAAAPDGGGARVSLPPASRPAPRPPLALAPAALAPGRRAGPDGETVTMTVPRAPSPHAAPRAPVPPGLDAQAAPAPPAPPGRSRLGRALGAALVVVAIAPLAWRRAKTAPAGDPPSAPAARALDAAPPAGREGAAPPPAPASDALAVAPPAPVGGAVDPALPPPAGAPAVPPAPPSPRADVPAPAAPRARRSAAPARAPAREPPAPRPAVAPPPATAPPSARPPCDPPYYVDASGIRRVKRDCL